MSPAGSEESPMLPYTGEYYNALSEGARQSARVVVPLLLEFVRPRSVIDVGCGQGAWLSVFREHGVEDVWGVDGDYVERGRLAIPAERFLAHDLRQPLHLDRQFDLVVSLEVAEHLPAECAGEFVRSLAGLGPAGCTDPSNHEAWPGIPGVVLAGRGPPEEISARSEG